MRIRAPWRRRGAPGGQHPLLRDIEFHVDSPSEPSAVSSLDFELRGWVATRRDPLRDLELTGPELQLSLEPVPRPDVEAVYPDHHVVGFAQQLFLTDLASGPVTLSAMAGGQRRRLPIEVAADDAVLADFTTRKRAKLARIADLLRCSDCGAEELESTDETVRCRHCGHVHGAGPLNYRFLSDDLAALAGLKHTDNISSNAYDRRALDLVEQYADGWILDNGSGMRRTYYDNVVNFEIADYPTTDVLGVGERLPFRSGSFDAVFSFAVLEHVRRPFDCAEEIIRVLKPGGLLYVQVPFLQPFHGYPDHYYNMTSNGLRNLFEPALEIEDRGVPPWGLPVWGLSWFLRSYLAGLPDDVAAAFAERRVGELVEPAEEYLDADFVVELSPAANEELACANFVIARKPEPS